MKKLLFLTALFACLTAFAQNQPYNDNNQEPVLSFNQENFRDRFAVMTEKDNRYHYFVTDLTEFSSRVERTYFLNLVYEDHQIISIDSDLSKDQLWYKAPLSLPEDDVISMLDDLRRQAINKVNAMTDLERASWMEKHSKFNEKND